MGHLGHKFIKRFLLFRLSLQNRAKVIFFFHNWLASSSRKEEVSTIYKETRNVHKFFSLFLFRITKSSAVWFCGWRFLKWSQIRGGIEAWRGQMWILEWWWVLGRWLENIVDDFRGGKCFSFSRKNSNRLLVLRWNCQYRCVADTSDRHFQLLAPKYIYIGWGKCVWATQRGRQVTKKFSVVWPQNTG